MNFVLFKCRQWGESGVCPENGMLEGVLLLPISSLFSTPKFVLWKRVDEFVGTEFKRLLFNSLF